MALLLQGGADAMAQIANAAPEPSDHQDILLDVPSHPGIFDVIADVNSVDDLSLGSFHQRHSTSTAFNLGMVAGNLSDELTPLNSWVAPVYFRGSVLLGVVSRQHRDDSTWYVADVLDADTATEVAAMLPGDRLLHWAPNSAWFVVRDEFITPINDQAELMSPQQTTLSALQRHALQRQGLGFIAPFRPVGRWLVGMVLSAVLAAAAVFLLRRR